MGKLDNKLAIISGATSGIGAASAELFAQEGATVVLLARQMERGIAEENKIREAGGKAYFYKCDVTNIENIREIKDKVMERWGHLDILFNNAGMLITATLEDITDDDWDAMYNTNLKSMMHMCQEFIGILIDSHGVILNNTSINGLQSYIKGRASYMYASSKAAAVQFTRYLALNYAKQVRVNGICPGITETGLFTNRDFSRFLDSIPMGRIAKPEEIAKTALFMVSDDSSFMTGSMVVVDGGESIK